MKKLLMLALLFSTLVNAGTLSTHTGKRSIQKGKTLGAVIGLGCGTIASTLAYCLMRKNSPSVPSAPVIGAMIAIPGLIGSKIGYLCTKNKTPEARYKEALKLSKKLNTLQCFDGETFDINILSSDQPTLEHFFECFSRDFIRNNQTTIWVEQIKTYKDILQFVIEPAQSILNEIQNGYEISTQIEQLNQQLLSDKDKIEKYIDFLSGCVSSIIPFSINMMDYPLEKQEISTLIDTLIAQSSNSKYPYKAAADTLTKELNQLQEASSFLISIKDQDFVNNLMYKLGFHSQTNKDFIFTTKEQIDISITNIIQLKNNIEATSEWKLESLQAELEKYKEEAKKLKKKIGSLNSKLMYMQVQQFNSQLNSCNHNCSTSFNLNNLSNCKIFVTRYPLGINNPLIPKGLT